MEVNTMTDKNGVEIKVGYYLRIQHSWQTQPRIKKVIDITSYKIWVMFESTETYLRYPENLNAFECLPIEESLILKLCE
jgi:hypothetical protein